MKILIYAHHFPPSVGGMQYQNLQIAQGLSSLGHQLEVISCDNPGASEFIKGLKYPVHLLPKWSFTKIHSTAGISILNWLFIPKYIKVLKGTLEQFQPEVILVADESSNFFWGFFASRCKVPYVSYCSVPLLTSMRLGTKVYPKHPIKRIAQIVLRRQMKISYESARVLLAVSRSTRAAIAGAIPSLADRIQIVPNSVDDTFFISQYQGNSVALLRKRFGFSKDDFVILSVTRLTSEKGVDDVMKALDLLEPAIRKRFKYIVVGSGPAQHYLERLRRELNLLGCVHFAGRVPHLELIPYYDMCDIFVLPPRRGSYESFGRVFVEAATRKKPSIATRSGGMLDVVDEGLTGYLVSEGDTSALCARLVSIVEQGELVRELGENALAKARRHYTQQAVALKFSEYLERARMAES